MKIALLTDGIYPYVVGGIQKHSYYLAKYLARNKIYVELYHTAPIDPGDLKCFTDVERKFISSIFIEYPSLVRFPGHYLIEQIFYSKLIFQKLLLSKGIDFIYAQGLTGLKAIEHKTKINVPIGVNLHGLEMFQKTPNLISKVKSFYFKYHVKYILKNSDLVFSLGKKLTEILIELKVPKEKIIELPIGIGEDWIINPVQKIENEIFTFLFVGRYERRKGIEELNEAILRFSERKELMFLFVGDIPENLKCKFQNVHYLGKISDQDELKKIYKKSDVLICPSHAEGMPTVILEAMASGLAIIASDVGAVGELVDSTNGVLMDKANRENIEKAILFLIDLEKEKLNCMKFISLEKVNVNFRWEVVIKNLFNRIKNECKAI